MVQMVIPAVADFDAAEIVVWMSGGVFRVHMPMLLLLQEVGLGDPGQVLTMNDDGDGLEWRDP